MWHQTTEDQDVAETRASRCDSTYSLLGGEGVDSASNCHQSDRERGRGRRDIENGSNLDSKAAATASVHGEREDAHPVQEEGVDEDHIYFVLEGPTPNSVKGECKKRQEVDDAAAAERQEVEATPYEIPLTKKEKQNLATKNADKS